jgi:tetratricopeptide (TPR) repeat protein
MNVRLRRAGLVLFALVCAGWFRPEARLWGVHHMAFLPAMLPVPLLACAGLLLSPIGEKAVRGLGKALKGLAAVKPLVWVAMMAVVFVVLRVREPLLGDGQAVLRHLETMGRLEARYRPFVDKGSLRWTEPLETLLHERVFSLIATMHPPVSGDFTPDEDESNVAAEKAWFFGAARWTYILLSAAAGAVFVFLVLRFARKMLSPPARPVFLLTMFSASAMLLFFGYVEDYAWTAAAICACLLFAIEENAEPHAWPRKTLIAFALSVAFHVMSLILLPALVFFILARQAKEGTPVEKLVRARWLIPAVAVLALAGYAILQNWPKATHLLPLFPAMSRDGYALFAPAHLVDFLNLIVLCAALPVAVVVLLRRHPEADASEIRITTFLSIAAVCGLAFTLCFDPNLAMPRDWDLYSVALWPLIVFGAWRLSQVAEKAKREELIAIMGAFAMLVSVPYLLENISTKSEIARVESVLKLDPSRAAYGWENVAAYYRRVGDSENTIKALREAVTVDSNPHYKLNLANELRRAGRLHEAELLYIEAAHARPEYAKYLLLLAQDYSRNGEKERVLPLARIMVEIDPKNPVFTKLVADLERTSAQ